VHRLADPTCSVDLGQARNPEPGLHAKYGDGKVRLGVLRSRCAWKPATLLLPARPESSRINPSQIELCRIYLNDLSCASHVYVFDCTTLEDPEV
jgi:hypothetical protein